MVLSSLESRVKLFAAPTSVSGERIVRFNGVPLVMAVGFTIGTVALSLYLLPRLKGALVALQWAHRMHGFGAPAPVTEGRDD